MKIHQLITVTDSAHGQLTFESVFSATLVTQCIYVIGYNDEKAFKQKHYWYSFAFLLFTAVGVNVFKLQRLSKTVRLVSD